jgi:hypothetical protein
MADLIAIGYDDTTTAVKAMDEVESLAKDLVIQPDAVAAIIRNEEDKYRTVTNQHLVGAGATWGMFWGLLGLLFFVPRRADDGRQGPRGTVEVRRHRAQDLAQRGPRRRCKRSSTAPARSARGRWGEMRRH